MTRKKVKLAYIANDSVRKATFKKRKKGLMKKVSELSTLCGIEACAIVNSPFDTEAEVWPSPLGVQRVVAAFKKKPDMEQCKKMDNQETFLRQRITKTNDHLQKQRRDNREKEVTQVMFQSMTGKPFYHLNLMDLNDIGWVIEQRLKGIDKRMDGLANNQGENHVQAATQVAAGGAAASSSAAAAAAGGEDTAYMHMQMQGPQHQLQAADPQRSAFEVNMESMLRDPWLMDPTNPQDQVGFGGIEMMQHFWDPNCNAFWSNPFFP